MFVITYLALFCEFSVWLWIQEILQNWSKQVKKSVEEVCSIFKNWKKCYKIYGKKSTSLSYHVKKHRSTLEIDTFKVMLLLSYLASLDKNLA